MVSSTNNNRIKTHICHVQTPFKCMASQKGLTEVRLKDY
jgi:hypothetical protein